MPTWNGYNGDASLDVRKIGYGKKRQQTARDKQEAHRAGTGTYERKAGDRVYDPSICPEAFTVKAGVEERPGSE